MSAENLNRVLGRVFDDEDVFRIDHYLGKETVQNLLGLPLRQPALRAAVEPAVHRSRTNHGSRDRGRGQSRRLLQFAGAMRDMIQSHLLQLMAVVAMEPPPRSAL